MEIDYSEAPWGESVEVPAGQRLAVALGSGDGFLTPLGRSPSRGPTLYSGAMPRRIRFRPPGLKPTTRIGGLGPYRGRLGLGWVIAPIVAGVVIVVAAVLLLR
jgi:hypothetical protein